MITILKTDASGNLVPIHQPEPGCWICAIEPSNSEIDFLGNTVGIAPEFMSAALDAEETSHIDKEMNTKQTLIIADCCLQKESIIPDLPSCITVPLSFIFMPDMLVTISIFDNPFIENLVLDPHEPVDTSKQIRVFLQIMMKVSQRYQYFLRLIEASSEKTSEKLYQNMNNRGISEMMELDKSLIYFAASLKADENTLRKIRTTRVMNLPEDDIPLLDDVLIEYQQASDMCSIYTTVNERISSGCSNIISNNMNDVMKKLTVITLVMSIPNMIYGFYGMNVTGLPVPIAWFPLLISIIACIICWAYFRISRHYR